MHFEIAQSAPRLNALRSALLSGYVDEDLHQLRVTLRRMRSVLRNVQMEDARKLRRALGRLARATNPARDWDTLVACTPDYLHPGQLNELLPLLLARRDKAREQVYRMLHSRQWLTTIAHWQQFTDATELPDQLKAFAQAAAEKRLQRAKTVGREALKKNTDKHWHKLRIAIKELRYILDSQQASLTTDKRLARLLALCRSMQSQLGDWHDTVIHRRLLDELIESDELDTAAPTGKAAALLRRALLVRGQQCLEEIKRQLKKLLQSKSMITA